MRTKKKILIPLLIIALLFLGGLLYWQFEYKTHFALVGFQTAPEGATVIIDGEDRGVTPLTVELREGEYELFLKFDGYDSVEDQFTVVGQFDDVRGYVLVKQQEEE